MKKLKKIFSSLVSSEVSKIVFFAFVIVLIIGVPSRHGVLFLGDTQSNYIFSPGLIFGGIKLWLGHMNSGAIDYLYQMSNFFSDMVVVASKFLQPNLQSYFYFFFGYFLFTLSTYYLFQKFFNKFVSFLLAVVFLVSPIVFLYNSAILVLYSFGFINIAMIAGVNIIRNQDNRLMWRNIFLICVFLTLANVYFQNIVLFFYLVPLLIIFQFSYVKSNFKYLFKNIIVIALLYFIMNLPWIYTAVYQITSRVNAFGNSIQTDSAFKVVTGISSMTTMFDAIRLVPLHYVYDSSNQPLAIFQTNILVIFFSFAMTILAVSSVLFAKNKKLRLAILFCLIVFTFSTLLVKGNDGVISHSIFAFFWRFVPLFTTFRTLPKLLFASLYTGCFMAGVTLTYLLGRYCSWYFKVLILAILLVPLSVYFNKNLREVYYNKDVTPTYYTDMKNEFNPKLQANTFLAPQTDWQVVYNWRDPIKDTENISPLFLNTGVLTNGAAYDETEEYQNYNDLLENFFLEGNLDSANYLMAQKNIRYILLQRDVVPHIGLTADQSRKVYQNIEQYKKTKQFGVLEIYNIPDNYFSNQVFSPNKIVSVENEGVDLIRFSPILNTEVQRQIARDPYSAVVYKSQNGGSLQLPSADSATYLISYANRFLISSIVKQSDKNGSVKPADNHQSLTVISNLNISPAQIEFNKISSNQYEVIVHNTKELAPIILNQNYDPGWQLVGSKFVNNSDGNMALIKSNLVDGEAGADKISQYRASGKISYSGEGFISGEYGNSIQNNNIPKTNLTALYTKPIDTLHYKSDGANNLFVIDPSKVCNNAQSYCRKNQDGTYDIKLALVYKPHLLYIPMRILADVLFYGLAAFLLVSAIIKKIKRRKQRV